MWNWRGWRSRRNNGRLPRAGGSRKSSLLRCIVAYNKGSALSARCRPPMLLNISQIGQVALPVVDIDRSEKFYGEVLGFGKLYRFGDLSFFDCAGRASPSRQGKRSSEHNAARLHLFQMRRHCARGDGTRTPWLGLFLTPASHCQNGRSRSLDGVLSRPGRTHAGVDARGAERLVAALTSKAALKSAFDTPQDINVLTFEVQNEGIISFRSSECSRSFSLRAVTKFGTPSASAGTCSTAEQIPDRRNLVKARRCRE